MVGGKSPRVTGIFKFADSAATNADKVIEIERCDGFRLAATAEPVNENETGGFGI